MDCITFVNADVGKVSWFYRKVTLKCELFWFVKSSYSVVCNGWRVGVFLACSYLTGYGLWVIKYLAAELHVIAGICHFSLQLYTAEPLKWITVFIFWASFLNLGTLVFCIPLLCLFMLQCLCSPESYLQMHVRSTSKASTSGKCYQMIFIIWYFYSNI